MVACVDVGERGILVLGDEHVVRYEEESDDESGMFVMDVARRAVAEWIEELMDREVVRRRENYRVRECSKLRLPRISARLATLLLGTGVG